MAAERLLERETVALRRMDWIHFKDEVEIVEKSYRERAQNALYSLENEGEEEITRYKIGKRDRALRYPENPAIQLFSNKQVSMGLDMLVEEGSIERIAVEASDGYDIFVYKNPKKIEN